LGGVQASQGGFASADGRIAVNHQPVALEELQTRLAALYATRRDKTLYVMGDGRLAYGRILEAIDKAKGAGVERVGVVTESMRQGRDCGGEGTKNRR
jgi:biopolymer transport protein ExbD